jgi:hypothetical protein
MLTNQDFKELLSILGNAKQASSRPQDLIDLENLRKNP